MKPKYLITNVVYGSIYTRIFLGQHLKSVLDETNLPLLAETYDIEYLILSDAETTPILQAHPNMITLAETIAKVSITQMQWGNCTDHFNQRYSVLIHLFKLSVEKALKDNAILTCWVADLIVAKNFFPLVMQKIEAGHDAVLMLPLRSAAEVMCPRLDEWDGALPALKLFKLGYENMHPLWWACHWANPMFTKLPFTLLWNNGRGLRAHSYSLTPIIFKPNAKMLEGRGMIDGDVPEHCTNAFIAHDWTDAPTIGVEPLFCYYPTFANRPASIEFMREWQKLSVHHSQIQYLEVPLYYPSKTIVGEIDVKDIPGQIVQGYKQD